MRWVALLAAVGCERPAGPPVGTIDVDDDTGDVGFTDGGFDGETWVVDCAGGGDVASIQAAIDIARSGDRIDVRACEYHERIDLLGKRLEIVGTSGAAATVIDAGGEGPAVTVVSGESLDTRIAGFTIRGGRGGVGSAVVADHASLWLEDVVLTGNGPAFAVLHAQDALVTLVDAVIAGNDLGPDDAAIYAQGGGFTAHGIDVDCDDGGSALYHYNVARVDRAHMTCADGIAVNSYHGEFVLRRSRFHGGIAGIWAVEHELSPRNQRVYVDNVVATGAVGMHAEYLWLDVENAVFSGTDAALDVLGLYEDSDVDNAVLYRSGCGLRGDGAALDVAYTAAWDNDRDLCDVAAEIDVTADPRFVGWPDDVSLAADSPLVDAGNPELVDVDGTRSDIGARGGPFGDW